MSLTTNQKKEIQELQSQQYKTKRVTVSTLENIL